MTMLYQSATKWCGSETAAWTVQGPDVDLAKKISEQE